MYRQEKYERFYQIICLIPKGKVATYGQIAELAGYPKQARQVGYALRHSPDDLEIPWQRVINAKGEISPRRNSFGDLIQRQLLEREGVQFGTRGRISLDDYGWRPEVEFKEG